MSNSLLENTGFKMTDALKKVLQEQQIEITPSEDEPIINEPPLRIQSGIGVIRFLCDKATSKAITGNEIGGDDRIVWDRRFLDQIHEARKQFYELLDKGYKAFKAKQDGLKSDRRLLKFDPNAEEIIMIAPHTGG